MSLFRFRGPLAAFGLLLIARLPAAEAPLVLTLHPDRAAGVIPADFAGLSFEMQQVLPDRAGVHFFRPDNRALIATLRALDIHSLRVGGNTTDNPAIAMPGPADLDPLFALARAADANVIFTLRLRQGDPAAAAATAQYLMRHYADRVVCFAVGNEPDVYDHTYPAYLADFRHYVAVITAPDRAPGAVFGAPGTTPPKAEWARRLADDLGAGGRIRFISQHEYPGGNGRKVAEAAAARQEMLSPAWVRMYGAIARSFVPAAQERGLPFRLEETNNYYNGGAKGVSDTFAAALWGLDYLHWWAAHGAAGLNFHTGDFVAAADELTPCRYAVFRTEGDGYAVKPLGYALKLFALGGRGRPVPVTLGNPDGVNVTAYAVLAGGHFVVTLVNKELGAAGRPVLVRIAGTETLSGATLALTGPGDGAVDGLRLGGSAIAENGAWAGQWTAWAGGAVTVPACSALLLRF